MSYENFEKFWHLFTHLYKEPLEQRQELMDCDDEGRTNASKYILASHDFNTFKLMFAKFKETVGENDIKEVLSQTNLKVGPFRAISQEAKKIREFISAYSEP